MLVSGTRLGPYEIVNSLGAGGMGEVYRARDTRLNRDVALKVLPALFVNDPERLARFTREAHVLASLSHRGIAAIYGVEESPGGAGKPATRALVMELVGGDDLSVRIGRGPIPVAEALAIAGQIADALDAAHEQGIIHRDLKPANVKVTDDGVVKVLDFGLAKALGPEGASATADPMLSPTMTSHGTELGMILGTAAYMSPEQAKGKAVDRRADIWAFGVVLFEMLTGRQVFEGDTTSEVMASVMKDTPDWSRLPANLPPAIVRLLHRCLEKDPRKRLSAIGDARFDLDDTTTVAATPAVNSGWSLARVAIVGALCALVAAAGTWAAIAVTRSTPVASTVRTSMLPAIDTALLADSSSVALSPDGRTVAFVTGDTSGSNSQLWVRRVDALNARAVEDSEHAVQPFWSPDSRQIGFFTKEKLKRVPADGRRVEEICDIQDSRGGTWSSQDVIVFAATNGGGLSKVSASGGPVTPATSLDAGRGETGHRFPWFLPDGDHFLYVALPPHAGAFDVLIGSVRDGKSEPLMKAESAPVFAPPGFLLFDRKAGLVAQAFDPDRRTLSGEPQSLEDVPGVVGASWLGGRAVSVSAAGSLAYVAAPPANTGLVWFDLAGREIGKVPVPPAQYESVAVSPDGRRAVAERRVSPAVANLWMIDLERGGASRFTNSVGVDYWQVWSPDGERVAFSSTREGSGQIIVKSSNGAAAEDVVFTSKSPFLQPLSWSADGRTLVFNELNPATNRDIWLLPMPADRPGAGQTRSATPYAMTPASEQGAVISPDGKWMAYLSDETGRFECFVQAFPVPGRKYRVSTNGAVQVWWRKDSRQLLLLDAGNQLLQSDVVTGSDFSATPPKIIGHLPKSVQTLDAPSDLQRVLALTLEGGSASMSIALVQDWAAGLRK